MKDANHDHDIRQPSINTEPRTLNESTLERAKEAAQEIFAANPEPSSDCFTKDATDVSVRENLATTQGKMGDGLSKHLDDQAQKTAIALEESQRNFNSMTKNPDVPSSRPIS